MFFSLAAYFGWLCYSAPKPPDPSMVIEKITDYKTTYELSGSTGKRFVCGFTAWFSDDQARTFYLDPLDSRTTTARQLIDDAYIHSRDGFPPRILLTGVNVGWVEGARRYPRQIFFWFKYVCFYLSVGCCVVTWRARKETKLMLDDFWNILGYAFVFPVAFFPSVPEEGIVIAPKHRELTAGEQLDKRLRTLERSTK